MIQSIIPVLPATNIKETIFFYESKLGFTAFDKGGYAILKKGSIELHFYLSTDKLIQQQAACCFKVSDIECLFIELSAYELVTITGKLEDKPRGLKEFSIRDNNGNLIRFTEEN